MTAAAMAAVLMAAGYKTPQDCEKIGTRALTTNGTETTPTGGCGVGCSDVGTEFNALGDTVCNAGFGTPATLEQVNQIIVCRGQRTDSLNY